jgi:hypothetical protein
MRIEEPGMLVDLNDPINSFPVTASDFTNHPAGRVRVRYLCLNSAGPPAA